MFIKIEGLEQAIKDAIAQAMEAWLPTFSKCDAK